MKPSKDKSGKVTVELTDPEVNKLRSAWPVLEQLAYHSRGGKFNGVPNNQICDAAKTVSDLVCAGPVTEPPKKDTAKAEQAKTEGCDDA